MALFGTISGDEDLKNIDDRIENLFTDIPKNNLDTTSADNMTGSVIDSFIGDSDSNEVSQLFENITVPNDRVQRYQVYEEMNRAVPIIKRILRVYIANILQKNPVDGKCIIYKEILDDDVVDKQEVKDAKTYVNDIVKHFNIVYKLKNRILPLKLLYGDCYIEIIDVKKESEKIKVKDVLLLHEANQVSKEVDSLEENYRKDTFEQQIDPIFDKLANLLIVETDAVSKEKDIKGLDSILLRVHKPHNIISLVNTYGSTIGFLEIDKADGAFDSINNISKSLSQTVGKVSTMANKNSVTQDEIINKLISHVVKKIISKSKASDQNADIEKIIKNLDEETYSFIKRMIIEQGLDKKNKYNRVKVKFISPENMVNIQIPSSDNFPYGESINFSRFIQ